MITQPFLFQLKVQRVHETCLFELAWGQGQQLGAELPYPEPLMQRYRDWQRIYLSFYKTALRGRIAAVGTVTPGEADWHTKLVQAEAKLLSEFHRWLRQGELFEIRSELARTAVRLRESGVCNPEETCLTIFLTCNVLDLERLPWEAWEIGAELATAGKIRIARTPLNVRAATGMTHGTQRRGKARILAILGDETGLNFEADRRAVRSLAAIAEVEFVGWQPGCDPAVLKAEIGQALTDERGWEMLFFAGHSNEAPSTGGELAIAPGVALSMRELVPKLHFAIARGLRFALFNSCNGLDLAASLIDLGLSQVVVMREPVHNQVAQAFLLRFLQVLATYKDAHEALLNACQELKVNKNFTYPSAHLVPSLFCHPEAVPFCLQPYGWQQQVRQWLPTQRESAILATFLLLSLLPPLQNWLLQSRMLAQAVYRAATHQFAPVASPSVLLVQIDETSVQRAEISDPYPMDRRYLAQLIQQVAALDAQVVGVDYLLDRPHPDHDAYLTQAIKTSVAQTGTWFVFAATETTHPTSPEIGIHAIGIANPGWSLQGYVNALPQYLRLLPAGEDCFQSCPFVYLLAGVQLLKQQASDPELPQPGLQNSTNLRSQILTYLNQHPQNAALAFWHQLRLPAITRFSEQFGQLWLRPINDLSLPPPQVYDPIPAWKLLDPNLDRATLRSQMQQQVVLIASGGYAEAGINATGTDNLPVPWAIALWQELLHPAGNPATTSAGFTGGEAQAYMIHNLLTQHLVIPIPDLWMVALAGLCGKGVTLMLKKHPNQKRWWRAGVVGGVLLYGLVGLQVYITTAVLLPWFLPSMTLCFYVIPDIKRMTNV